MRIPNFCLQHFSARFSHPGSQKGNNEKTSVLLILLLLLRHLILLMKPQFPSIQSGSQPPLPLEFVGFPPFLGFGVTADHTCHPHTNPEPNRRETHQQEPFFGRKTIENVQPLFEKNKVNCPKVFRIHKPMVYIIQFH